MFAVVDAVVIFDPILNSVLKYFSSNFQFFFIECTMNWGPSI